MVTTKVNIKFEAFSETEARTAIGKIIRVIRGVQPAGACSDIGFAVMTENRPSVQQFTLNSNGFYKNMVGDIFKVLEDE